ncbi:MAG: hypothetical protein DRP74_05610 [Candidatus Omnitrophota bacterium]|nr:MAG: hypothetical protein DRP74_05610 [Candidatus Omnitrophota bacterium]
MKRSLLSLLVSCVVIFTFNLLFAQQPAEEVSTGEETEEAVEPENVITEEDLPTEEELAEQEEITVAEPTEAVGEAKEAKAEDLGVSDRVTLDFKEADIRNVLKIISYKAGVNIITTPEVMGNVTIRLVDVPWQDALDAIVKTYGYGYDKKGNIITVAPIEKLTALKRQEVELAQVQPTLTEVFKLKFIDAQDAKKALEPQLSPRGRITVLEMTGQGGWAFGTEAVGKRQRITEEKVGRSKVLIISDIVPVLDKIKEVVNQIDIMPQQVLIETKIMEVNRDVLRDIGFDWGLGSEGSAQTSTVSTAALTKNDVGNPGHAIGGHLLGSETSPSVFNPKDATISGTEPFNMGLELLWQKIGGTEFEAILHALEEDVSTNTLSAPRILALNNQEASILIGTRYPILQTEVAGTDTTTTTITLDYYQDIGIQLNVVPQIGANNYINMVLHPAVTDYSTTLGTNAYPIINTREAETRVVMKDGETVVIGGLLKDVTAKGITGIPILSKIPLLGVFFRRETTDTQKIDLLIFITANIIKEGQFTPEEIGKLEKEMAAKSGQAKSAAGK